MKRFVFLLAGVGVGLGIVYLFFLKPKPPLETKFIQPQRESLETATRSAGFADLADDVDGGAVIKQPEDYFLLKAPRQVYQTFNNCGPATLSMILSWYGTDVSQKELGENMRPYQNPKGDNDDKTIFTQEFSDWAERYGLHSVSRVNGSLELLKLLVANDIPVVVKTWLRPNEDIGHFRIVRGFDQSEQVLIQDDSYHGPNRKISYYDFLSMWQPFNYAYIIVYPSDKEESVRAILLEEWDESVAWSRAVERARQEEALDPGNVYPPFNQATSLYHLGKYDESVAAFERVEGRLPRRMLWYQIEPIQAYQKLGQFERVLAISDTLLNNGNRAFSELYLIRGEIYLSEGDREKAREQFELALVYNRNFQPAREALEQL